ncbi:PSMD2-like protein [Mya arenaria]|uniref:PSMD2-like protein n=1 Tax=Mya arenaria TaxID=6604 RepID=A0ABY7DW31_MYAAR|nr:PSMD2-like protein [Mya arenaria]
MADTAKKDATEEKKDVKKGKDDAKDQELSEEDKQLQDELTMLVERLTRFCADIVSVLGMTFSDNKESLKYRLLGSKEEIGSWGHEYVRHLAGQVAAEWQDLEAKDVEMKGRLLTMAKEIVPYHMAHNAEAEGCDLLMEVERLDLLQDYVDDSAYQRVCLYLTSCVAYVPDPENITLLKTAVDLYQYDELTEIISNTHLNNNFLALARELDIMEPKVPEDIYKSHLEPTRGSLGPSNVDSARQNLASSFVNGFVNAAFGQDKLLMEDGNKWLYKNKEHGMMTATASLGLVLLWDVDGGLTQIDKYLYSSEDYIKAGALLACGIVNSGVRNECDPALALLSDYVMHTSSTMRIGAIIGLGLAYAGSNRDDVLQLILPVLGDSKSNMEVLGIAALSCGMIAASKCNGDVTSTILQTMMERSETELKDTFARFLALGLALNYLGRQEAVDATLAALEVVQEPLKSMAYMLDKNENKEDKKKKEKEKKEEEKAAGPDLTAQQGVAVLGLALISMGEDIGAEMCFRSFSHLLRYGEVGIRRAVPLALGLLSVSNPKLQILDTLSKFSHDNDPEDPNNLFMVRMAQGLTHLGKGTLTLCPYHSDRTLMSPVAVAGLMAALVACLDVKNLVLGKSHYLLYHLVAAMQPRMLVTFDEEMRPLPVAVRVGQAVDVVGQAGKPKTITGFQTHTTPVLLAYGERAELATDELP